MIYIMNQGGGAKQLAIKVLGGITQPTGKAGYIWINTATEIGKYTFSVAEPSSPASGDVWIQTNAASTNVVELLRTTNSVKVNILRVKQYNGAGWDMCRAYYHNGTDWAQVSFTFDPSTDITYTGDYTVIDDGGGDWRIKFLTSGNVTFSAVPEELDTFLVGGGGGGGANSVGRGGGGGYTTTNQVIPVKDTAYTITVGSGSTGNGGTTSAFGLTAGGGQSAANGSNGGSGGGDYPSGNGGSDGSDGSNASGTICRGQGTTTREFAEASGTLYAGGGGANSAGHGGNGGGGDALGANTGDAGDTNTGGGGGYGWTTGGSGGSGIVIIRNHRAA